MKFHRKPELINAGFYLIGGWKKDLCLSIKVTFTGYDFNSKH